MRSQTMISAIATVSLLASPTFAQEQQQQQQQQQQNQNQNQIAENCQQDLAAFGQRIQEEGYWLTGVRDRWGTGTGGAYYPGVGVPGTGAGMGTGMGTGAEPGSVGGGVTQETAETTGAAPAWGLGIRSPGVQIETLFRGAQILAVRGDEEGCQAVLSELTQVYDEYVGSLQEAGVDPGQVTGWRQEMIAAAQPVGELDMGRVSIDEITGTEVRNMEDERLGSVDDVLLAEGQVQHVVISHGGFLGVGEDYRVVPWEALMATPNMNLILLDISEEQLEQAPRIEGDVRRLTEDQDAQVREYWGLSSQ